MVANPGILLPAQKDPTKDIELAPEKGPFESWPRGGAGHPGRRQSRRRGAVVHEGLNDESDRDGYFAPFRLAFAKSQFTSFSRNVLT
jgi:hypothetical protein